MRAHSPKPPAVAIMLFCISLTCSSFGDPAGPSTSGAARSALIINTEVAIIALQKNQALKFTIEHNLNADAADGLKALNQMVRQKKAESVANPSVTSNNGQRGTSDAETMKLEAEPTLSPPGDMIEVNIALTYYGKKLTTAITVRNGEVRFIGAFDSNDKEKDFTYLAFSVVRSSDPMPPVGDMFELNVSANEGFKIVDGNECLPVVLKIKNKTNEDAVFGTIAMNGNYLMSLYSLDNGGKMTFISSDEMMFSGPPLSSDTVKAGTTKAVESEIPKSLLLKCKRAVISIASGGSYSQPSYTIYSEPFSIPTMK